MLVYRGHDSSGLSTPQKAFSDDLVEHRGAEPMHAVYTRPQVVPLSIGVYCTTLAVSAAIYRPMHRRFPTVRKGARGELEPVIKVYGVMRPYRTITYGDS
ncbi:hypothetical protein PLICRDRAFT_39795 [Plicaturopsis crispa FD-325 SS-3]|nr:hypothetical protein PLICRDRAFT_39795 [Plicaturopsis crispa FD-325 SS-3]